MKISKQWLQTFFDTPFLETSELSDALTFHAFEVDGVERVGDDDVFDVKVTPNRGHDCLSHRGIAKEFSAILGRGLAHDPFLRTPRLDQHTDAVTVKIHDAVACPRYIAGMIRGVRVGPSPEWLVQRLASMGQRSINNIVDATNMVMFETGQPLHAFDAERLNKKDGAYAIEVRQAREGETMLALDDKQYTLGPSVLVIADAHADVAIGVAGVKGGAPAGITEATTDIIIESANFNGALVRRAAAYLKLRTDASSRFEQILSPELAAFGMQMVVDLISKLAGGEVLGFVDVYPVPQTVLPVQVTAVFIERVLGMSISGAQIESVFERLGFVYEKNNDVYVVTPPFERLDIVTPEDLVEEVGRIIGYDKIPAVALSLLDRPILVNKQFYYTDLVREFLGKQGFSEVYTSVFAERGERVVLNKVDGVKPYLRSTLVVGVTEALDKNARLKDVLGVSQVRLYEIGTIWKGGVETLHLCVGVEVVKKQPSAAHVLVALSEKLGVPISHDNQKNVLEISFDDLISTLETPLAYEHLPTSTTERYRTFSRYPFIVRDVALWATGVTNVEEVHQLIQREAGALCVRLALFDTFTKDGRISFAFRVVFQATDRTLTDAEVEVCMEKVYTTLKAKGFEIR